MDAKSILLPEELTALLGEGGMGQRAKASREPAAGGSSGVIEERSKDRDRYYELAEQADITYEMELLKKAVSVLVSRVAILENEVRELRKQALPLHEARPGLMGSSKESAGLHEVDKAKGRGAVQECGPSLPPARLPSRVQTYGRRGTDK